MSTGDTAPRKVPTISRIAGDTIVELIYAQEQQETALVVSRFGGLWNIEREVEIAGEKLVPYSPHNNLIAHNCVLFASKPEAFGTKEELVADIEAFLHRYVDLSPSFERIAAHYVLLAWLYDAFAEVPYLRLRGEYGTGKTRALIAIGSLCYKPFFAAGASTVSPIFHTLDRFGGTLILDEADFRFSDATVDLVKIFNNGTVKGLPVLRTVQNRHNEFNPAAFNVFGPKIVAMRGSFADDALESRFLTEETGTRPLRSDIPLHVPDSLHSEALVLRNRLLHYRLCTLLATKPNPGLAVPGLDPRLNQIALPLLALVDDAAVRTEIEGRLRGQAAQTGERRRQSLEGQVLAAALETLAGAERASVQAVTDRFNRAWQKDTGRALSPRRVGSVLRNVLKIETHKRHGVYVVAEIERERLVALAARYGIVADADV